MEEEGDLKLLDAQEWSERERKKYLKFCFAAYPFKEEEGVFIVSPEKEPFGVQVVQPGICPVLPVRIPGSPGNGPGIPGGYRVT